MLLPQEKGVSAAEPRLLPPAGTPSQTGEDQELGWGRVSQGLSLPHGSQAREGGPRPPSQSWLQSEQWLQAQEGQRARGPSLVVTQAEQCVWPSSGSGVNAENPFGFL